MYLRNMTKSVVLVDESSSTHILKINRQKIHFSIVWEHVLTQYLEMLFSCYNKVSFTNVVLQFD